MSQEKVDRNKELKRNRKEILKKQRRQRIIGRVCGAVIAVVIVGWIGFSAWDTYEQRRTSTAAEVDLSAITDYLSGQDTTDDSTDTTDGSSDTTDASSDTAE